jgi:acyl-CoA thioesterase I
MQNFSSFIVFIFLYLTTGFMPVSANEHRILILGDSLSAAYNITLDKSWPVLFANKVRANSRQASVINASISGETSFGGLARINKLLEQHQPTHLIIELGGNDGLRGLDFNQTTHNLLAIGKSAKERMISILLIGVRMPPNLGIAYNAAFQSIFESVTQQLGVAYLANFLEGIAATDPALMQADGIHPTSLAQPALAEKVYQAIKPLL